MLFGPQEIVGELDAKFLGKCTGVDGAGGSVSQQKFGGVVIAIGVGLIQRLMIIVVFCVHIRTMSEQGLYHILLPISHSEMKRCTITVGKVGVCAGTQEIVDYIQMMLAEDGMQEWRAKIVDRVDVHAGLNEQSRDFIVAVVDGVLEWRVTAGDRVDVRAGLDEQSRDFIDAVVTCVVERTIAIIRAAVGLASLSIRVRTMCEEEFDDLCSHMLGNTILKTSDGVMNRLIAVSVEFMHGGTRGEKPPDLCEIARFHRFAKRGAGLGFCATFCSATFWHDYFITHTTGQNLSGATVACRYFLFRKCLLPRLAQCFHVICNYDRTFRSHDIHLIFICENLAQRVIGKWIGQ